MDRGGDVRGPLEVGRCAAKRCARAREPGTLGHRPVVSFYPVVYFAGAIGLKGATTTTVVQVGYTIADIVAKAGFGVLIYMIAVRKSAAPSVALDTCFANA